MITDFLFPRNRGKVQPLNPSPSSKGVMAYADGVNWNPIGDGAARWVIWTGTAWVGVPTIISNGILDMGSSGDSVYTEVTNQGVTALPNAYKYGLYTVVVSNDVTGWPETYGIVFGMANPNYGRHTQVFFGYATSGDASVYVRKSTSSTTWGSWIGLGGQLWIDYSGTSTIVGWSTFTNKVFKYLQIGKIIFVKVTLVGTSNSTSTTFTLPVGANTQVDAIMRVQDNSGALGSGLVEFSGTTVTAYSTVSGSTWTASGTKVVEGQFFYDIA